MTYRKDLQEWQKLIRAECHILDMHPALLFQQAANQPESNSPARMAVAHFKAKKENRPWLRWINNAQRLDLCRITLVGHEGPVHSVHFSPDGRMILSGSYDRTIKIWDIETGRQAMTLTGHKKSVNDCVFSPEGKLIVSASSDKTLKIWDAMTGKLIATLEGHAGKVLKCLFSPNGKNIVSVGGRDQHEGDPVGEAIIWDVNEMKPSAFLTGHRAAVNCCCFSPDGNRILTSSNDRTLKLWDSLRGKELSTFNADPFRINTCRFLNNGNSVLIHPGDHLDSSINWNHKEDAASFEQTSGFKFVKLPIAAKKGTTCAISSHGDFFVVGQLNDLSFWNLINEKEIAKFNGHMGRILACSLSQDERSLATAAEDAAIKIWDISEENLAQVGKNRETLEGNNCHFMPNGKAILSHFNTSLKLFELSSEKFISHVEEVEREDSRESADFCLTPDGKSILKEEDRTLKLLNVQTGMVLAVFGKNRQRASWGISPDGKKIFSIMGSERFIKLWDREGRDEIITLTGHTGYIEKCMFSPDNRWLLSFSPNEMKLWDGKSFANVVSLAQGKSKIFDCSFSPDGKLISTIYDDKLTFWWAATGEKSLEINTCVDSGIFSPDGKRFLISRGGRIKILDSSNGCAVLELEDYSGMERSLSFSPDGQCFVTASEFMGIRLHDATSGIVQGCFVHSGSFANIEWSPDSRYLLTGGILIEVMNRPHTAPILTAWRAPSDDRIAFGCPFCRLWSVLDVTMLGNEVSCQNCRNMVRLNCSTLDSDWRSIAEAWKIE